MEERTGSRAPHPRKGGGDGADRAAHHRGGDPAKDWWDAGRILESLPDELRSVADHLSDRLFLSDDEADDAVAGRSPDTPGGRFLTREDRAILSTEFRRAILESTDRGAPPGVQRLLHRRLDREILRLGESALEHTLERSRRMVHDLSHDIRSPLNSVLFLADTLLSGHSGVLNDIQRRQLGVLYTAAVTLVGLVNDVIDTVRLRDSSEIPVSHDSFSLESVLGDVENLVAPLATHRSVRLRFHLVTLGPRSGDRQLLSRVLLNLVTNATKAVEEGGAVEVQVREPREGWLRVTVCDDGPKESVEQLRALIEDETDDLYASRGGVGWTHGLGLTVSSRLVRAAGGTMNVASQRDRGTCFQVEVPFARV